MTCNVAAELCHEMQLPSCESSEVSKMYYTELRYNDGISL
jgi:hypothetical protein